MFAALRRLAGRLTVAICACSVLLPATAESHALWNDDLACSWSLSSSDDAPAQVTSATSPDATHCALCHWLRAIGGAVPSESALTLSGLAPREILLVRLVWWHDEMRPLARPSRAPPAFDLL
jgi:hypothetical protein